MRILNLYCGIGGNRQKWGNQHQITAVEIDPVIAAIYQALYPNDTVIIGDAHEYLLNHYSEFDFVWSSPPCPTHSVTNHFLNAQGVVRFPDMQLYQEIILLQTFFKGMYCVENVKSYYTPLITPQVSGRHYFWANFRIPNIEKRKTIGRMNGVGQHLNRNKIQKTFGVDLSAFNLSQEKQSKYLRNCVEPKIGAAILQSAFNSSQARQANQLNLFNQI
jgi:DNA (cytosine-5)-methyltransferase 1